MLNLATRSYLPPAIAPASSKRLLCGARHARGAAPLPRHSARGIRLETLLWPLVP